MTRIAHISDVHFGTIKRKGVVEALLRDVHEQKPDLVAVSGDLTQRAYSWQYRAARRFLNQFQAPVLVVPGNHDVWPMWVPWLRYRTPVSRFQRLISPDLAPMLKRPEAWVLGLNSSHGYTVKGGKVAPAQIDLLRRAFQGAPPVRVLVVHHPLIQIPFSTQADVVRGGQALLEAAAEAGVSTVLSGHLHVIQNVRTQAGPILVHAGSATSSRSRAPDSGVNSYNMIELDARTLTVERRDFDGSAFQMLTRETLAVLPQQEKPGIGFGR